VFGAVASELLIVNHFNGDYQGWKTWDFDNRKTLAQIYGGSEKNYAEITNAETGQWGFC
jgi:hypothetical protein